MSDHTFSEVGVNIDKICIDLKVNAANFGVCRLANNGRNFFMWEDLN